MAANCRSSWECTVCRPSNSEDVSGRYWISTFRACSGANAQRQRQALMRNLGSRPVARAETARDTDPQRQVAWGRCSLLSARGRLPSGQVSTLAATWGPHDAAPPGERHCARASSSHCRSGTAGRRGTQHPRIVAEAGAAVEAPRDRARARFSTHAKQCALSSTTVDHAESPADQTRRPPT